MLLLLLLLAQALLVLPAPLPSLPPPAAASAEKGPAGLEDWPRLTEIDASSSQATLAQSKGRDESREDVHASLASATAAPLAVAWLATVLPAHAAAAAHAWLRPAAAAALSVAAAFGAALLLDALRGSATGAASATPLLCTCAAAVVYGVWALHGGGGGAAGAPPPPLPVAAPPARGWGGEARRALLGSPQVPRQSLRSAGEGGDVQRASQCSPCSLVV